MNALPSAPWNWWLGIMKAIGHVQNSAWRRHQKAVKTFPRVSTLLMPCHCQRIGMWRISNLSDSVAFSQIRIRWICRPIFYWIRIRLLTVADWILARSTAVRWQSASDGFWSIKSASDGSGFHWLRRIPTSGTYKATDHSSPSSSVLCSSCT